MSEEDFWNSSIAKIFELAEIHIKVNKLDEKNNKFNDKKRTDLIVNDLPYIDD